MSGAHEFEERLRRMIGSEQNRSSSTWVTTAIVFASGVTFGIALQQLRVPMRPANNAPVSDNRWRAR